MEEGVEDLREEEIVEAVVEGLVMDDGVLEETILEEIMVDDAVVDDGLLDDGVVVEEAVVEDIIVEDIIVDDRTVDETLLEDIMEEDKVVEDNPTDNDDVVEDKVMDDDAIEDGPPEEDTDVDVILLVEAIPSDDIGEEPVEDTLPDAVTEPRADDESEFFDDESTEAKEATDEALLDEFRLEDNDVRLGVVDEDLLDASGEVEETAVAEELSLEAIDDTEDMDDTAGDDDAAISRLVDAWSSYISSRQPPPQYSRLLPEQSTLQSVCGCTPLPTLGAVPQ